MSHIVFAELASPIIPAMAHEAIVYCGETSFFVESRRLEKGLAQFLRRARFQIRGKLVELEGSWFEGIYQQQTAFLFTRDVLKLDLRGLMRCLDCCAVRMYQVEYSTVDVAYLLIGHQKPVQLGQCERDGEKHVGLQVALPTRSSEALLASYRMSRRPVRPNQGQRSSSRP